MNPADFNDWKAYRQALYPVWKQKKLLHGNIPEREPDTTQPNPHKWAEYALYALIILIISWLCVGCSNVGYTATLDQWADAIHKAEGNDNYGILQHYKYTTYRQACKNTVLNNYQRWQRSRENIPFLQFLGRRYCPTGASNDPTGLNRYWVKNVEYWLKKRV